MSCCPECSQILVRSYQCQCGWKKPRVNKSSGSGGMKRCTWINDGQRQCEMAATIYTERWFCSFHWDADSHPQMTFDFALFQEWMNDIRQTLPHSPWASHRDEYLWASVTGTYGNPFIPGTPPIQNKKSKPQSRTIYPVWFDDEYFAFIDQILKGSELAPVDISTMGMMNAILEWMERTNRPQWKIIQEIA